MSKKRSSWLRLPALAFALAFIVSPCGGLAGAPARRAPDGKAKAPRLAILISVDGLSWSRLISYRPWYTAGLKRLLGEGFKETAARYQHLNTETGPGHAALGTGSPPRLTGIVANHWYEPDAEGKMQQTYCTDQVTATGRVPGPVKLRVPTLGDRLVEAKPASRVVSLGGKDRAAIFLAGKDPRHAVYWFDRATGRFTSSSAYDAATPTGTAGARIAASFNSRKAGNMLRGRFGLVWRKLAPPSPVTPSGTTGTALPQPAPNLEQFQNPINGLGPDHDLGRNTSGYFSGIYYSPWIDELTMDLALAFLSDEELALGRGVGSAPDLLSVSFIAQDTVSHYYGSESDENLDVLRRLDLQLARLFAALDETYPAGSVVLALSADHGFALIPEAAQKRDKSYTGGRLIIGTEPRGGIPPYVVRLNRLLDEELCLDPARRPIRGGDGWDIFYDRGAFPMQSIAGPCGAAGRSVTLADLNAVVRRVVLRHFREEVKDVLLASDQERWPTDGEGLFARNDYFAGRSGDAILIPNPGVLMIWDAVRGTGHGSHYESEIHVPLIFWGGGIPAGESGEPTTPYDLAPTLARLLGVPLPGAAGRALTFGR
ncbi:MAG: alkaline phosphatase family protein [Thermoanaerobaculia bacterium]